jgi:hypothetical protein
MSKRRKLDAMAVGNALVEVQGKNESEWKVNERLVHIERERVQLNLRRVDLRVCFSRLPACLHKHPLDGRPL